MRHALHSSRTDTGSQGEAEVISFPNDAVTAFCRDRHACLMLAMATTVGLTTPYMGPFLKKAPADIIRTFADHIPIGRESEVLFRSGLLSAKRFEGIAIEKARGTGNLIRTAYLASPLLSKETIVELLTELRPETKEAAVLMANPNCPPSLSTPNKLTPPLRIDYLEALCLYCDVEAKLDSGDLDAILKTGASRGMKQSSKKNYLTLLAKRKELPEKAAHRIAAVCDLQVYAELVQNPTHRRMVREGKLPSYRAEDGKFRTLVLSPEATSSELEELSVESENATASILNHIVSHPNASAALVESAIESWEYAETIPLQCQLILNQSPMASAALTTLHEQNPTMRMNLLIPELIEASPELLEKYCDDVSDAETKLERIAGTKWAYIAGAMVHPNFPWEKTAEVSSELKENLSKEELAAIYASRAIAGVVTPGDLKAAETDQDIAASILFASNLSSYRLATLVEKHPSLTPMAAIHPNGGDIDTTSRNKSVRELVEPLQMKSLQGSSGRVDSSRQQHILAI